MHHEHCVILSECIELTAVYLVSPPDSNIFVQYSSSFGVKSPPASSISTLGVGRTDSSESEMDDSFIGSPRSQRKAKPRSRRRTNTVNSNIINNNNESTPQSLDLPEIIDELAYIDTLPEEVKLVEVTSNIWGTKFKIHGLAKTVPANLGQVTYKTSLLHLQPRQMTLVITELRDDYPTGPDPNFNPNIFSEDEEEHIVVPVNGVIRRHADGPPAIAPMSPRPGRFTPRARNSPSSKAAEKQSGLGPLAKTESYEDDFPYGETSDNHSQPPVRPKHIETSSSRPGPSYASLVTQYSRSASSSSGQSRHAISPLCSEGSVPTLQSPKNAVGPSDIIFDRPPPGQTTLMNYSSNADYSVNIGQVKSALMPDQVRINSQVTPVPLNLNLNLERNEPKAIKDKLPIKKKDLQFIDDDTPTTSTMVPVTEPKMHRTTTIVSIAPAGMADSMTRSCSVGYLDSVDIIPSDVALSLLRKEAPNKRLVLVDRKPKKNKKLQDDGRRMKLLKCAKSKSLDLCDLLQASPKLNNVDQGIMPKLFESTENPLPSANGNGCLANSSNITKAQVNYLEAQSIKSSACSRKMGPKHCAICRGNDLCAGCQKVFQEMVAESSSNQSSISVSSSSSNSSSTRNTSMPPKTACDQIQSEPIGKASGSKNARHPAEPEGKPPKGNKKKSEVITSYTDSPLFSRKHRFGDDATSSSRFLDNRSPILGRRFESGLSFIKQLSEARKRRKEEIASNSTLNSTADLRHIEAIPVEQKSSISLHTQALTTLENIISRLRDLDESRTPPASPQVQRHPRSSPASPAPSKKGRRHQSASPIRQILNSPLLNRRQRKKQPADSSDDESINSSLNMDDHSAKQHYRDLETFQKAQLRQKVIFIITQFSPQ